MVDRANSSLSHIVIRVSIAIISKIIFSTFVSVVVRVIAIVSVIVFMAIIVITER